MKDEERALANSCIIAWSETDQINMIKEELAELIVAVSHLERGRENCIEEVYEEHADVLLMLDQLTVIMEKYDSNYSNSVEHIKSSKQHRTLIRLHNEYPDVIYHYMDDHVMYNKDGVPSLGRMANFTINGRQQEPMVETTVLSYEDICELAGYNPKHVPSVVYDNNQTAGSLTRGETIRLFDNTHINCIITGNG